MDLLAKCKVCQFFTDLFRPKIDDDAREIDFSMAAQFDDIELSNGWSIKRSPKKKVTIMNKNKESVTKFFGKYSTELSHLYNVIAACLIVRSGNYTIDERNRCVSLVWISPDKSRDVIFTIVYSPLDDCIQVEKDAKLAVSFGLKDGMVSSQMAVMEQLEKVIPRKPWLAY